jgi:transmembrane sensor
MSKTPDDAAGWAARLDAGPLGSAEERAFSHWLEADLRNFERLEGCQRLYGRLGTVVPRLVDEGRLRLEPTERAGVVWPNKAIFRRFAVGLAAAGAVLAAFVVWENRPQSLATHAAQRQALVLADGSHVDLNAQTSLSVRLRGSERRVRLDKGEAFFDVSKDPSRPFYVDTPLGTVRVTGTHFDVRLDTSESLVVTVVEGSVAVKPSGGSDYSLKSRDQLTSSQGRASVAKLTARAADDAVAWREGRVVFDNEPLASAVERFAHYHGTQIDVAPEVATLELGGRFELDDLDHFLRDIALTLPIQVLRPSEGPIRIVAR